MSTPLTDQERHQLWEAGDHHPEMCDCAGDDWSAEGEWCGGLATDRIVGCCSHGGTDR